MNIFKKKNLKLCSLFFYFCLICMTSCGGGPPPIVRIDLEKQILSPGKAVKLFVLVQNFTLSKETIGGANQDRIGHFAVYLGEGGTPLYKGADFPYMLKVPNSALPGKSSLRVVLLNNDGQHYFPEVSATLPVEVEDFAPKITLKADNTGVTAGDKLNLSVKILNYRLRPLEENRDNQTNEGHFRVFLGANNNILLYTGHKNQFTVTIPYSATQGKQEIRLVLYKNDKTRFNPLAQGKLSITIKPPPQPSIKLSLEPRTIEPGKQTTLRIQVSHFLLDGTQMDQPDKPGTGHYAIYMNENKRDQYEAIGSSEFFTVNIPAATKPGKHSFRVALRNNSGTLLSPSVEERISFVVTPPPANKPKIQVSLKSSKVRLDQKIEMQVKVENFLLDPQSIGKQPKPGTGHFRVYLNDNKSALLISGKENNSFLLPKETKSGEQFIRITLNENNGSPLQPPVSIKIQIEVSDPKSP